LRVLIKFTLLIKKKGKAFVLSSSSQFVHCTIQSHCFQGWFTIGSVISRLDQSGSGLFWQNSTWSGPFLAEFNPIQSSCGHFSTSTLGSGQSFIRSMGLGQTGPFNWPTYTLPTGTITSHYCCSRGHRSITSFEFSGQTDPFHDPRVLQNCPFSFKSSLG
jgi:hypothetical protein